jgi:hypothetical protein
VALFICLVIPPLVPAVGLELPPSSHTMCLPAVRFYKYYIYLT